MTTWQTIAVLTIVFIGTFTRSAVGFGDALIAMPLLALLGVSIRTATPLIALQGFTISVSILSTAWRSADLKAAWRLVLSSLIGIPFGLLFLKNAPEATVKAVLGLVLVSFGLYNLIVPRLPTLRDDRWAFLFGWIAGVLGGAYNTNGPAVVIYSALRNWSPESFRSTLQSYFLPTAVMVLAGHALAGLWTATVWRLYLYALPCILLAVFLGGRLNRVLSGEQFRKAVYAGLVVMGGLLFF